MKLRNVCLMIVLTGLAGCASAPVLTPPASPSSGATVAPSPAVSPTPAATLRLLGNVDADLDAGTYRWASERRGIEFPVIQFTVPAGWIVTGRFIRRPQPDVDVAPVAMQFWDVGLVYGHPCQWEGTLFDPGATVDALATALADIPLRNASAPIDVTLDGYAGKYLEWSVPTDIDFETCDADAEGHYFDSWSGDQAGWGGDRYQQGPGQVDRLWILDVEGVRFVIDAFSMPDATDLERAELLDVVGSVRFERP